MSKKSASAMVSAAGYLTSIFSILSKEVEKAGGTDEDMYRLACPDGYDTIVQMAKLIADSHCYPIKVTGTIGDQVKLGNYDSVNDEITGNNFNCDAAHACDVIIKSFSEIMCIKSLLKALDNAGLRPATMSELLSLGGQYPELQRKFNIVALGAKIECTEDAHRVACLFTYNDARKVNLIWIGVGDNRKYHFAAVRK